MIGLYLGGTHFALAESTDKILNLTLSHALQLAQQQSVQNILAQERIQKALINIEQEKSRLTPDLELKSSQTRQTKDLRSSGISLSGPSVVGPFNSFDLHLELTQTIFDKETLSRLKSVRKNKELSLILYLKIQN